MSFLKFALFDQVVVDAYTDPSESKYNADSEDAKKAGEQFRRTVTAAKSVIKKSADFLYVRTRAIGSLEKWGPNMNGDGFPMEELRKSYSSFVGKGNFIDHKSDDITKIRGLVIDAYLNNDDQCVETLIAVDKKSHPQLARDIDTGTVNSVSMGTRVGWSKCSVCENRARTEKDYCSHIANYKGMKISFLTQNAAHRMGQWPVHEVNHDLEFIELSWVAVPAFQDAHVLEKIASLKTAVDNGFKTEAYTTELSEDEKQILAFASAKDQLHREASSEVKPEIPEALRSIAEAAACQNEECAVDPRRKADNSQPVRTAAEMRRITITYDDTRYRRTSQDYGAEGKVVFDGKDYEWWASSADKSQWNVSLEKDLYDLLSARGQKQLMDAVTQLIQKNLDSSELIVAKMEENMRKVAYFGKATFFKKFSDVGTNRVAYFQNFEDDQLMEGKRLDPMLKDMKEDRKIYDNKDLQVPDLPKGSREAEQEAFEQTAKEGPAGALGKPLAEKDQVTKHDEKTLEKLMRSAYLNYLSGKVKKS